MKCEGTCSEHIGDVRRVRVQQGLRDWGDFWYCDVAVDMDRSAGFTVTDSTAEPQNPTSALQGESDV